MSCEIDELFGLESDGPAQPAHSQRTAIHSAANSSDAEEVDQLFGVQQSPPAATEVATAAPSLRPLEAESLLSHKRKRAMPTLLSASDVAAAASASHVAAATCAAATAASVSSRPTKLSTAEAERLHVASVRAAALARRAAAASSSAPAAAPSAAPYKSLLSNRDIIFNAPILSGDSPFSTAPAAPSVFVNAPSSFSTNSHFATGNSTAFPMMPKSAEELGEMLRQRDDVPAKEAEAFEAAVAAAAAAGSSALWPISMRGKSVATVSASNAMKSKLAHRAALEREQEFKASSESMPMDSHVHGPGISDHSTPKAHYDNYWTLRVQKLEMQHANAQVYDALPAFQTDERRSEEEQRKRRKQERHDRKEADATRPCDVPFTLAQSTQSTMAAAAASSSFSTQVPCSLPSRSLSSVSGASSATAAVVASSRPRVAPNQLFAGVCAYINGDTETRVAGIDLGSLAQDAHSADAAAAASPASASELSCYHLGKLVQLGGGRVLPYASRTQLTHYVTDHLSYSKCRSEMHALMGGAKAVPGAAARHIHIVRPEWIRACRQAGRRVSEEPYSVLRDSQHISLSERWKN